MNKNANLNILEDNSCMLCGDSLVALTEEVTTICDVCGKKSAAKYQCKSMHYICNDCLETPKNEFIKQQCLAYAGNDPVDLVVQIMNSPQIKMHGPEHHFILPAVLATCMRNHLGIKLELSDVLDKVEKRAIDETPSECDFKGGNCGSAVGAGVYLSMHLAGIKSDEEIAVMQKEITDASLKAIHDHGGPRCCKRDTYLTLDASLKYFKEKLNIELPYSEAKCTFSLRNQTCGMEKCVYYNISNSLV
jgi:uncharacterized protein DUF5714